MVVSQHNVFPITGAYFASVSCLDSYNHHVSAPDIITLNQWCDQFIVRSVGRKMDPNAEGPGFQIKNLIENISFNFVAITKRI